MRGGSGLRRSLKGFMAALTVVSGATISAIGFSSVADAGPTPPSPMLTISPSKLFLTHGYESTATFTVKAAGSAGHRPAGKVSLKTGSTTESATCSSAVTGASTTLFTCHVATSTELTTGSHTLKAHWTPNGTTNFGAGTSASSATLDVVTVPTASVMRLTTGKVTTSPGGITSGYFTAVNGAHYLVLAGHVSASPSDSASLSTHGTLTTPTLAASKQGGTGTKGYTYEWAWYLSGSGTTTPYSTVGVIFGHASSKTTNADMVEVLRIAGTSSTPPYATVTAETGSTGSGGHATLTVGTVTTGDSELAFVYTNGDIGGAAPGWTPPAGSAMTTLTGSFSHTPGPTTGWGTTVGYDAQSVSTATTKSAFPAKNRPWVGMAFQLGTKSNPTFTAKVGSSTTTATADYHSSITLSVTTLTQSEGGEVTFWHGTTYSPTSTHLCSFTLSSATSCSYQVALTASTTPYKVHAHWAGNTSYNAGTSTNHVTLTVDKATVATTITITNTSNGSTLSLKYGTETTKLFVMTVTGQAGEGEPTPINVSVMTPSGNGVAACTGHTPSGTDAFTCTAYLLAKQLGVTGSPHQLHAYYSGGTSTNYTYAPSTSESSSSDQYLTVTITPETATTTTKIRFSTGATSGKTVTYGSESSQHFKVTVVGQTGDGYPTTGTVTIRTGSGNTVGTCGDRTNAASYAATYTCSLRPEALTAAPSTPYTLHAYFSDGTSSTTNYTYNSSTSGTSATPTVTLTVDKANPGLTVVQFPATGVVGTKFTATAFEVTLSGVNATGTITFRVFGPSSSAPSTCSSGWATWSGSTAIVANGANPSGIYHATTGFTPSAPGKYWWYANYTGDKNYNGTGISCASATPLTLSTTVKAPIAVLVTGTKTYGSTAPSFQATYTNPTPSNVTITGTVSCTEVTAATATVSTATLSAGLYTLKSTTCGGLSLSGADAGYYFPTYVGGVFSVNKAPLAVTVTGSMIYGTTGTESFSVTTAPPGTVGFTTVDLTCTQVSTGGGKAIGATLTAGHYTLTGASCSGLTLTTANAGDYTLTTPYTGSTFTVNKAEAPAFTVKAAGFATTTARIDYGSPVTFVVTGLTGLTGGTVYVYTEPTARTLCTFTLSTTVRSCSYLVTLTPGTIHHVWAHWTGNSDYFGHTSAQAVTVTDYTFSGGGGGTTTPTLPPASPAVTRVAGSTPDATAAAEFERAFDSAKGTCPVSRAAVLATTKEYEDALSSQFLAQSLTTGTLLTPTTSLAPVTLAALKAEGITTVDVVGGSLAISTAVVKAIESLTAYGCGGSAPSGKVTVLRIAGPTAEGTAMAIAEHVGTAASMAFAGAYGAGKYNDTVGKGSTAPAGAVPTAILASASEFQDAEAASAISYHTKLPLLLTGPTSLSATALAAMTKLGIKQVILMGGPFAVSDTVEAALVAHGIAVLRIAGKDATDTARQLARFETAGAPAGLGWTPGHRIMVTRGDGFTDGIAGAVLDSPHNTATGAGTRPLLLTESPTTIGTYLTTFLKVTCHTGIDGTPAKTVNALTVLGGTLAVTTAAVASMQTDLSH
jgi:putative cell wall-binding protein